MSVDSEPRRAWPLTELLMTAFLRLVAVGCLYFGAGYWGMLIGYSGTGTGRFDLLSLPWKAAATCLAVLYPVAAIGLWLRASWGPVIWVGLAAIEILMHEGWPEIFGPNRLMTILIGAIIIVYIGFRIALFRRSWLQKKAAMAPARIAAKP